MGRLVVCGSGDITVDIEAMGSVLHSALESEQAEALVRCAVLMALSSLVEGGTWPRDAMQSMRSFMARMKDELSDNQLQ